MEISAKGESSLFGEGVWVKLGRPRGREELFFELHSAAEGEVRVLVSRAGCWLVVRLKLRGC